MFRISRHNLWHSLRGGVSVLVVLSGLFLWLPSSVCARNASVTFLYTGDICGTLNRSWNDTNCRGLIPCAGVVQRQRLNCADTMLLDCGNFYGSRGYGAFTCPPGKSSAVMAAMGYDAWMPGWQDWRCGRRELQKRTSGSVPMLAANASFDGIRCRSHIMREVDGVRVVVVGLIDEDVPRMHDSGVLDGVLIEDSVDALSRIMPEVRKEDPGVTVLLLDSGVDNTFDQTTVRRIVRCFPEFDVILTKGHQRSHRMGAAQVVSVPVSDGCVGQVLVQYDTTQGIVTSTDVNWLQTSCDPFTKEHLLYGLLSDEVDQAQKDADRVVGELPRQLPGTNGESGESATGRLLGEAVAEDLGCDAVFFRWPVGASLGPGPVRVRDIDAAYPDNCRWGILLLTPEELRRVISEVVVQQEGRDLQLGCYGVEYALGEDRQPEALRLSTGDPMHARKRYRVAFPQVALASYGGAFPVLRSLSLDPITRYELTGVDIYDAVIKYIERHYN